jgi:hypothetical protein
VKNAKSRRSVNIDAGYITALKCAAEVAGKTATGIATMILTGAAKPLVAADIVRADASHGVSMAEYVWLSLRSRSESLGVKLATACERVLDGTDPSLTAEELEQGKAAAEARAGQRAEDKDTRNPSDQAESSAQTAGNEKKSLDKVVEPDQEYYGGVFSL